MPPPPPRKKMKNDSVQSLQPISKNHTYNNSAVIRNSKNIQDETIHKDDQEKIVISIDINDNNDPTPYLKTKTSRNATVHNLNKGNSEQAAEQKDTTETEINFDPILVSHRSTVSQCDDITKHSTIYHNDKYLLQRKSDHDGDNTYVANAGDNDTNVRNIDSHHQHKILHLEDHHHHSLSQQDCKYLNNHRTLDTLNQSKNSYIHEEDDLLSSTCYENNIDNNYRQNDSHHIHITDSSYSSPSSSSSSYHNNHHHAIICKNDHDDIQNENIDNDQTTEQEYDTPTIQIRFSDIIGHTSAKLRLDEMLLPLALPPHIANTTLRGIRSTPASVLLYGPPGTGKTMLATAMAGEAEAALISIGPSDVLSKFVGESEKSIKDLFQTAKYKASRMESKCAIIFFDEIDALGISRGGENASDAGGNAVDRTGSSISSSAKGDGSSSRSSGSVESNSRRVLAELLIQMTKLSNESNQRHNDFLKKDEKNTVQETDSLISRSEVLDDEPSHDTRSTETDEESTYITTDDRNTLYPDCNQQLRIIVIAATNRPQDCDPALLRRFAVRIHVGLPTHRQRKKMFQKLLEGVDYSITSKQFYHLSEVTQGWTCSDMESVTREAAMAPIRECLRDAKLLKMKKRKLKKQRRKVFPLSGEDKMEFMASHDGKIVSSEGGDDAMIVRDDLLNRFQNLRPVTLKDFEDAISFWMGGDDHDDAIQSDNNTDKHHSSSSETSPSDEDSGGEEELHTFTL